MAKSGKLNWARHQTRWWGKWHLYLGIIAGFIVSVVGVTGSILVFRDEIDRALNPALFRVMEQKIKLPLEEVAMRVRAQHPQLHFDYIMNETDAPNHAYRLYDFKKEEEFFVNPYTAEISGKRIYESTFIHIVTDIHRTLLVPVAGRYIVGISSLILVILTITGLRLWIPQKWKQLRSVLTVKWRAGFKRQNYDWHNVIGFYSSPVVALLSLTGFCITFSLLVIPFLFVLSGRSPQGVAQLLGAKSAYTTDAKPLTLTAVVEIAHQSMPDSRVAGIAFPADSTGNFRLDMIGGNVPRSGKREMLLIDQYTGKVLLNSRRDFPPVGNAYLSWLTPIHYGSFGGRPTQVLALLGGLVPLLLFITGFIIWWPRYRRQRKKKSVTKPEPVAHKEEILTVRQRASFSWFLKNLVKGFRYAGWILLLSILMGALYGLPSGILVQPAVFTVAFTAILVLLNFLVAFFCMFINLLIFAPFKRSSRSLTRYFALSFSFALVFIAAYMLLINTGWNVF